MENEKDQNETNRIKVFKYKSWWRSGEGDEGD